MNKKLIIQLSGFGLFMAFATVFFIPPQIEPFIWLIIFVFCAWRIAKKCKEEIFLHGLLVSILNSVWITSIHILFYHTYLESHRDMAALTAQFGMEESPRLMMLVFGPSIGIISGMVLGFFSIIAGKLMKKNSASNN